jgi:hypothetical protein
MYFYFAVFNKTMHSLSYHPEAFLKASSKLRPIAITSPTLFMLLPISLDTP